MNRQYNRLDLNFDALPQTIKSNNENFYHDFIIERNISTGLC